MSILHLLQARGLPLDLIGDTRWTLVEPEAISNPKHRARFEKLREAVRLCLQGQRPLREVGAATGIPASTLHYYLDRALRVQPDGQIAGERALVPYQVRAKYTPSGQGSAGLAGQFKLLLARYPVLHALIKDLLLKGRPLHEIHRAFVEKVRDLGFAEEDYPLNTDSQGQSAVRSVCKKLESEYFREIALAKGGQDAARRADTSRPRNCFYPVRRPYQRLELDEHLLHAIFVIRIEELDGTERVVELKRLSILAAIDANSRAALGYRISTNAQPTIEDVALTLAHVLDPLQTAGPDIMGYATGRGVGLPDHLIEMCRYRSFDEIALDNALAHTSPTLHEALSKHVHCVVNLGKSAHPEGRPLIEGWFKLLNKYLTKQLPSTTGSHPKDPKRRHPEKKARRYEISLADLEQLIEQVIRAYNQSKPDVTNGLSPLECLRRDLTRRSGLVRRLRPEDRDLKFLFRRFYQKTIAGSVASGVRPYVQYLRAVYRNEQLASMPAMIRKQVTLAVDIRDLRCIEAYLPSGQSIGILQAQGGWGHTPHSLQTRQAINRHLKRRKVRETITDYVRWYLDDIARNNPSDRRRASITTRVNEEVERGRVADQHSGQRDRQPPARNRSLPWFDIGPEIRFDGDD